MVEVTRSQSVGISATGDPDSFGSGDRADCADRPLDAASLLVVAGSDTPFNLSALPPSVRVVAQVAPANAAAHLRQMIRVDAVWLADAGSIDAAIWAGLCTAIGERGCRLVCETTLDTLDDVVARLPAELRAEILVAPDWADRVAAGASVCRPNGLAVRDVARDGAMERIDRLQEEVARITRVLGEIAGHGPGGGAEMAFARFGASVHSPTREFASIPRSFIPDDRSLDRQRAKVVRQMLRQRRMREQYFPADLFADPAWDMLLDLYAARLERQPVSVSSLCIAAAVPATTALRWIRTMTETGLFLREADPHDGRRIFIALSDTACDAMARYFEALEE